MFKFTDSQLNRASEVAGNIAVAWFSAGAISPLLSKPGSFIDFLFTFAIALSMAGFFFTVSLQLTKGVKK